MEIYVVFRSTLKTEVRDTDEDSGNENESDPVHLNQKQLLADAELYLIACLVVNQSAANVDSDDKSIKKLQS